MEESKNHDPPTQNTTPLRTTTAAEEDVDMELETPRYPDSETDSVAVDLSSTTEKLKLIVEAQLDLALSGGNPQLSKQTELLIERLVSMSGPTSSTSSVNQASVLSSSVPPLSFAQVAATPKTTTLTASDVRRLPRLDGSPDADVPAVLSQYRLAAGFKAKGVRPDDVPYADCLAFEHLSLICDGPVLALYQQLSSGAIDWRTAGASSEDSSKSVGAFSPRKHVLLDLLMPSNSVEECALKLASFKQGATESVPKYTFHFRTITNRFESAVERQTKGRTPWAAFSVTLFQHGLIPSIQGLQLSDKPVTSLREAVDRARHHEAASLAGGTVTTLSFTPVPNRAAVSQYTHHACTESRPIRSILRVETKVGLQVENNNTNNVWYSSSLSQKPNFLSLSFSSRRVRVDGSVDGHTVTNITVDTATDVSVVSLAWLKSHPSLRSVPLKPVPHSAVSLRAANGLPLDVLGFIDFPLTLGGITCTVTALVVPSLGPDSLLLDNHVMAEFGAVLDWDHQILSFSSSGSKIPAVHRTSNRAPHADPCPPATSDTQPSVAAVHCDAEAIPVTLRERVDLKPLHEALVVVFTDCLPQQDCTVVVEPKIVSAEDISADNSLVAFNK